MRPRLATPLVLLVVLATSACACNRRIEDYIPGGKASTPFEERLWELGKGFQVCFEAIPRPMGEAREARVKAAVAAWTQIRRQYPAPPEGVPLEADEYALVLESMQQSLDRVLAAYAGKDEREAQLQAVALQHLVGELYGSNPGTVSAVNAIAYTVQSLEQMGPPDGASLPSWENRLALTRLRLERWLRDGVAGVDRLASVGVLRERLGATRALVTASARLDSDRGAEPARSRYRDELEKARKALERQVHVVGSQAQLVSYSPEALGRLLSPDDPEYDPGTR